MRQRLRLHREQFEEGDSDAPVTFQFPTAMAAARKRLVAGVVSVPPEPGVEEKPRRRVSKGVLARIDASPAKKCGPGVKSTDALMSEVERTLDRMQEKIDLLDEDVDQIFKFPAPPDDDWPRAA